jgi:hypothetical protein
VVQNPLFIYYLYSLPFPLLSFTKQREWTPEFCGVHFTCPVRSKNCMQESYQPAASRLWGCRSTCAIHCVHTADRRVRSQTQSSRKKQS